MIYDRFDFTVYSIILIEPKKPPLPVNASDSEAEKFAYDMLVYESAMTNYNKKMKERAQQYDDVHNQFRAALAAEYLSDDLVGTEAEEMVWDSAWAEGAEHGYAEMERCYENAAKIANSAAHDILRTQ